MVITDNFLLNTEAAQRLYHDHAAKMPIIDYHCHVNAQEIADDICYENITQAWISLDHYKWTVMRSCGVEEKFITAEGSDKEKFLAWAACLPRCIGNPIYHRSHMELKNIFGFTKPLNSDTAEEAWEICNAQLQNGMSARKLIQKAHVVAMGTTDDILYDLSAHDKLATNPTFNVKIVPTFRTDGVVNINLPGYREYVQKLAEITNYSINNFHDLIAAVEKRMDDFARRGCRSIDQALMYIPCYQFKEDEIDQIFCKVMEGAQPSEHETAIYINALLYRIAAACSKRGWVMQLHVGTKRDINTWLFRNVGVDVGGDCIGNYNNVSMLPHFMDTLNQQNSLPKMVIYSINPADNPVLDSMIGCFQCAPYIGKIQHGAAWWFNDTNYGIKNYIQSLANLSVLGNAIGALTDSRAFITYSRHEYFRRILCDIIGGWITRGEYFDLDTAGKLVEDICFHNVNRYFAFDL